MASPVLLISLAHRVLMDVSLPAWFGGRAVMRPLLVVARGRTGASARGSFGVLYGDAMGAVDVEM
jgi:hypothetical protein